MAYDFKTDRWQFDVNRFGRLKNMFKLVENYEYDWAEKHRNHIRENMREIQQRWPQFIKEDEIP